MTRATIIALTLLAALSSAADAQMLLSRVIIDLEPKKPPREDIEVYNGSVEKMYVLAEPAEVVDPGLISERRVEATDPEISGLLVSPKRMILEPGERRLLRISTVGERPVKDRIYRVAVHPVTGKIDSDVDAIKILVGYDALVIIRPTNPKEMVIASQSGKTMTISNVGNTSVELYGGKQCDSAGRDCRELPAKRLYAGASWVIPVSYSTPVRYTALVGSKARQLELSPLSLRQE